MTAGIYCIRNIENEKVYVGQSLNMEKRLGAHRYRLSRGTHENPHLQGAWSKYGPEAFEFRRLIICGGSDLDRYERGCINALKTTVRGLGYNIVDGGSNALIPEETKRRQSDAKRGNRNAMYGRMQSEETRRKIGDAQRGEKNRQYGTPIPEETRRKISEATIGEKNHMYGADFWGKKNPFYGKRHSPEAKYKMSEAKRGDRHPRYGKPISDEQRRCLSEGLRRRWARWRAEREAQNAA